PAQHNPHDPNNPNIPHDPNQFRRDPMYDTQAQQPAPPEPEKKGNSPLGQWWFWVIAAVVIIGVALIIVFGINSFDPEDVDIQDADIETIVPPTDQNQQGGQGGADTPAPTPTPDSGGDTSEETSPSP
ncbi:MAG: hypothetical protein FWD93_06045, partial [Coriobacteriia bacterium]|nr:hypothetical protein [Coriobacteriia bacterium]